MKYVLMFAETEEFAKELEAMGELERDAAYEAVGRWFAANADKITHHAHLAPVHTATTVRLQGGGEPVITDGRSWRARRWSAVSPRSRWQTLTRR
ncbi:hypothetical protein ABZ297_00630 [Nonomuraea sp. NPDC005983]|uniref:hypothetical protein n=1 Tax=Nonomuraea sp. NPDC005983 TaxID=3155595 RepID=UPI0033BD1AE0